MVHFDSPILLMVSLALVAAIVVIAQARRIDLRPLTRGLILAGLLLLALGAGGMNLELPRAGTVAVMIDVSPSTRTAAYRDRAALQRRVRELLGNTRFSVYEFAHETRSVESLDGRADAQLADWAAPRTLYDPPADADAVVLFSDGRFEQRDPVLTSPPTYAVVDPNLNDAGDARVERLEVREDELLTSVVNEGEPRELTVSGADEPTTVAGSHVVTRPVDPRESALLVARLNAGDAWPENDSLSMHVPPPERRQRWWVGGSARAPASDWAVLAPADLPTDPMEYLRAAVLVFDDVPADALSAAQQDRLLQYVRDLGGGAILLGGEHAFAAGAYPGTTLETISPLASTPPRPTTRWILLADSSGSMAAPAGKEAGATRWQRAADAVARVLRGLPPDDPVDIGNFARDLRWWSRGQSARQASDLAIPPADVAPHGPTNLQPALKSILSDSDGAMPTEILLLSDAETKLDPDVLANSMRAKRTRLHLLATTQLQADNAVKRMVESTGGTVLSEPDPQRWTAALRELLRAAAPGHLSDEPIAIRFTGPLAALPGRTIERWNHVWPKESMSPLVVDANDESRVIGATWHFGAGRAAAIAFAPTAQELEALAALVASPPRDARFRVSWDAGRELRVSIDAVEKDRAMNELNLELQLLEPAAADEARARVVHRVPQIGPGRYELTIPAPGKTRIATIRFDDRTLAQRAVAGRYAPEFDAIGTDRSRLRQLAEQTGGRVIELDDATPIDFAWARARRDLSAVLAVSGAGLLALGLVWWKLGG